MPKTKELLKAIDAADIAAIDRLIQAEPVLTTTALDTGGTLPVHAAVISGNLAVLRHLVETHGCDPTARNPDGDNALHHIAKCKSHRDEDKSVDPADVVQYLLGRGMDLKSVNGTGQTAVHMAAKGNKPGCLDMMRTSNDFATASGPDARGWTPMDMATAAGSTRVEDYMLRNQLAVAPPLFAADDATPKSTVDVLMAATKIDPKLKANETLQAAMQRTEGEVRAQYCELYRRPEFRSVLDLAAANALGSRADDPPATRIFMTFNTDFAGALTGKGGFGAFDPDSNTLALGADRDTRTLEGTIIHELTHHAADMVYGNEAVPFADETDNDAQAYLAAVEGDVKLAHHAISENSKKVVGTVINRIDQYVSKRVDIDMEGARNNALQEFLVGVPQAIHELGEKEVTAACPNMLALFKGSFSTACAQTRAQHAGFQARVTRNAELVQGLAPLPVEADPPEAWLDKASRIPSRSDLADLILNEYRSTAGAADVTSQIGRINALVPDGTNTPPLCHNLVSLRLPEDDDSNPVVSERRKDLYALQADLRNLVEPFLAEMPAELRGDTLLNMLGAVAGLCADQTMTKDQKLAQIGKTCRDTTRMAKKEYVKRAKDKGVTGQALADLTADAILYDAACAALEGATGDRDDMDKLASNPDLSDTKLAELRRKLAAELVSGGKLNTLADSVTEMTAMAADLAQDKKSGVYPKKIKRGSKTDRSHVSLNVKNARKTWTAKLATL